MSQILRLLGFLATIVAVALIFRPSFLDNGEAYERARAIASMLANQLIAAFEKPEIFQANDRKNAFVALALALSCLMLCVYKILVMSFEERLQRDRRHWEQLARARGPIAYRVRVIPPSPYNYNYQRAY